VLVIVVIVFVRFAAVAAVLEELQGRKRTHGVASRFFSQNLDGLFESEHGRRRNRDGEPEVEVIVPSIVLGHAGMGIDRGSRFIDAIRIDFGRDQT